MQAGLDRHWNLQRGRRPPQIGPFTVDGDFEIAWFAPGARHLHFDDIGGVSREVRPDRDASARAERELVHPFVLRMLLVDLVNVDEYRHRRIADSEAADLGCRVEISFE